MLASVKSLYDKATDPSRIELLLKIDDDDEESLARVGEIEKITPNYRVICSPQKEGYASLHEFVNELCSIAKGKFMLLWNDDAIMFNRHWDDAVELYEGKTCVIQMDNNHYPFIFPIISRDVYEILGHFSLNCHNDTWIHEVAEAAGIEINESEIYARHERPDVTGNPDFDDEVFQEGWGKGDDYRNTHAVYYSDEMKELRRQDSEKLLNYLQMKV
jgi:hypothetical protein